MAAPVTWRRYDRVAVALHWGIGVALMAQLVFGFLLDAMAPRGSVDRAWTINLHKSIGLVLLALILVRVGWRCAHRPPAWPAETPHWQRIAATWGHRALYAGMLMTPSAGYVASNVSKHGVKFFGLALAPWGPDAPGLYRFFSGLHDACALMLAGLVAGHIVVALWHRRRGPVGLTLRMRWSPP